MTARIGALDRALAERAELESLYKYAKRKEKRGLYADPVYGKTLQNFVAALNKFGPDEGDRMVEFVKAEQRNWLHAAPYEFRCAALTACSEKQMRVRIKQGLPALDDPLPGQPDNVFFSCKRVLGL